MGNWFTNLFKGENSEAPEMETKPDQVQTNEKVQPESGNMQMSEEQTAHSMDMEKDNNSSPEAENELNFEAENASDVEMPNINEGLSAETESAQQEEAEDKKEL